MLSLYAEKICDELDFLLNRLELEGDFKSDMYGEGTTSEMPSLSPIQPSVTISKNISEFPYTPDQGDLAEWFGSAKLSIPVVEIQLIDTHNSEDLYDLMYGEFIFEQTPDGHLSIFVLVDDDYDSWPTDIDNINGNLIIQCESDAIEIIEKLLPQIDTHLKGHSIQNPEENELLRRSANFISAEYYHLESVKSAYNEDRIGTLVVLLSIFFESHLQNIIAKNYPSSGIGKQIRNEGETNLKNMIEFCYARDELSEEEYETMDSIRDERNGYAHDLSRYHFEEYINTKNKGIVEKAINIYEEKMDLNNSVLATSPSE